MLNVEACYRSHGPMVLRRCRRLLGDDAQAGDAMHDVFVELVRRAGHLEGTALSSLLFCMATNVCLNRVRAAKRRPGDRPPEHDADLLLRIACETDLEARSAARALLERLFGQEPDSTRTIAVLHLLDRMTLEEVAAEVGLSVSGVRKRLRRLRARLGEIVEA